MLHAPTGQVWVVSCCFNCVTPQHEHDLLLQAPPGAAWKQPADPRREQLQHHTLGGVERPRLPRAGISAFAAPQVPKSSISIHKAASVVLVFR